VATELNEYLNSIENKVHKLHESNLVHEKLSTKEEVKRIVDSANLRDKLEDRRDFIQYAERFVRESELRVKPSALAVYLATIKHLRAYSEKRRVKLWFEDIDLNFYNDFTGFLIEEYNQVNNTIGKCFRVVKSMMNSATGAGLNKNFHFKSSRFKAHTEKTESIYLLDYPFKSPNADMVHQQIQKWVDEYNKFAPHSALNM